MDWKRSSRDALPAQLGSGAQHLSGVQSWPCGSHLGRLVYVNQSNGFLAGEDFGGRKLKDRGGCVYRLGTWSQRTWFEF